MIVVKIELHSAIDGSTKDLGTLLINNIGGTRTQCSYQCRMFKRGDAERAGGVRLLLLNGAKPIRQAVVAKHNRLSEPVHSLVSKALNEMGYN